jgi:hypothetical protein
MRNDRFPVLATLVALFALVLPTFVPSGLTAYQFNKHDATWPLPGPVLTIIVDDRGQPDVSTPDRGVADTVDAINSTSDSWNSTPLGHMIQATAGDAVTDFAYNDGTPMVRFDDPAGKCTGSCLALTSSWYSGTDTTAWRITDADTVFNDDFDWITRSDPRSGLCPSMPIFHYIENVIVHEMGHALGLSHSPISGATMTPSTDYCETDLITLSIDDSRGLRALYTGNPTCVAIGARCQSSSNCCLGGCVSGRCSLR